MTSAPPPQTRILDSPLAGPNYGVTANQPSKQSYHQNQGTPSFKRFKCHSKATRTSKLVGAHIGIVGNEAADGLAKKATKEDPKFEIPAPKVISRNY
ncbi:hypothetical protein AVEN_55543-1 [Araneus ventricosus]|uniref:RNase H type-1 domain-containing protein n=1 Tax=Araneus ventricosus TaxID=182803 RepID=A0A4Y2CBC6_ARAVE|nr:hypothetical protein AVEN_55543-1 [Araneus ventricosus]